MEPRGATARNLPLNDLLATGGFQEIHGDDRAPMSALVDRSQGEPGRGTENAPVWGRRERTQTRPGSQPWSAAGANGGGSTSLADRDQPARLDGTSDPAGSNPPGSPAGTARHPVFAGSPHPSLIPHLSIAGPPLEDRLWRRFVGMVKGGIEIPDGLTVITKEHGANARRIVHGRLRTLVLAVGRDVEVGP